MGAVLLQAVENDEASDAEQIEETGGPCTFDMLVSGERLGLHPIAFVSRKSSQRERSYPQLHR